MLRNTLRQFQALADAADRLARRPKITIELQPTGSDRARAEEVTRNLTPQYIAALKKKLGLS